MDKAKVIALIVVLYAMEIEARAGAVKEAAKENGVKEGELHKLLKAEGYEAGAPKGTEAPVLPDPPSAENNGVADNQPPPNDTPPEPAPDNSAKKTAVKLRHKTEYPKYRRAGLVLTQKAETYEVTEEQLAVLKKDPLVAIENEDGKNK